MDWNPKTLRNTVLQDDKVLLRRMTFEDKADLARIAYDPEIWAYFVARVGDEPQLNEFIEQAVADTLAGTRIVFSIVDRKSGRVAGSTAYGNLASAERRLEIGWSWLGAEFRGSGLNKSVKRLLLAHAFGPLECERVEFKTDILNLRARAGLKGIGATEEGTLRSFNFMPGGRRRDAIYYSVLKAEWPAVQARLEHA
ncbi:GNAT family protein [Ramlibacter sp.]|uniref:GNAT family N-acetyltransferase n=1 Tax=Ramlibacter sp. TaxID=1917967 RepID=UPI00184654E0|nr:GNAT family protein [Ramlibacter sp.]MBA2672954.1 GNAT family N-acetyltransferase [Ramlibacter sp.]